MVNFSDIFEGRVKGVKLIDKGSFALDTQKDSFSFFREYYGITAAYSEEYKPLVLEIEAVKTLFLLTYRNSVFKGANFQIELDGKEHLEDEVVRKRDAKKNAICKAHNLELIRVENSYARRYNYIKDILVQYFKK